MFVVQQTQVTEQVRLNDNVAAVAKGMIQIYRALGGGWQLRLEELAASGQCCKPLPSVDGGACDDYIGKQPPACFDAWCIWPEGSAAGSRGSSGCFMGLQLQVLPLAGSLGFCRRPAGA